MRNNKIGMTVSTDAGDKNWWDRCLGTFGGTNLPNKVLGTGKVEITSAFGI
jgi:hypothetical protein